MFKELDICGIYLPPFFPGLVVTALLFLPLHRWGDRVHLQQHVWNRPVFELALFVILLTAVTFILC